MVTKLNKFAYHVAPKTEKCESIVEISIYQETRTVEREKRDPIRWVRCNPHSVYRPWTANAALSSALAGSHTELVFGPAQFATAGSPSYFQIKPVSFLCKYFFPLTAITNQSLARVQHPSKYFNSTK